MAKFTANLHVTETVPKPAEGRGVAGKETQDYTRIVLQAETIEELKEKLGKHIEII